MAIDPGVPRFNNNWEFTESQWNGIILAGSIASILSLIVNILVVLTHIILYWFRPYAVNRHSLRMIVVACILNTLFCIAQLYVDGIPSNITSCRAFAYILTASDTMACMCLAMIGFNLVTVFVFKIPRSTTLEAMYYVTVALSGLLVTIVPAFAGNAKGPRNTSDSDGTETCWFHYYFDGRINNIFNWMWYYGWLMFSLLFAAICAAVSIRYVIKKQQNFTGAINMFTQRKKDVRAMTLLRKYGNNNTDIFRKIARRCICYPLVPFITKSWGVGIEIAAAVHHNVPYPIYVIDRVFSCLFGFMVGCIYFTDPAINAAFKEFADIIKTKYVYDYFDVEYQPGNSTDINSGVQNLKSVEIAPLFRGSINYIPPPTIAKLEETSNQETPANETVDITEKPITISKSATSRLPNDNSQTTTANPSAYNTLNSQPVMPTMQIQSQDAIVNTSVSKRRYSVVKALSTNGNIFSFDETAETSNNNNRHGQTLPSFYKKDKASIIPMRRLSSIPTETMDISFNFHTKTSRNTQKLIPFKFPMFAKFMHWVLIHIFRVKPVEVREDADFQQEPIDSFRNFTEENSGPSTNSPDGQPDVSRENLKRSSYFDSSDDLNAKRKLELSTLKYDHSSQANLESRSINESRMKALPVIPLRRASSINVATLQRQRFKNRIDLSNSSSAEESISENSSRSVATSAYGKPPRILTRMLGRRLSTNWNKFTKGKQNIDASSITSELAHLRKIENLDTPVNQVVRDPPSESSSKQSKLKDPCPENTNIELDSVDLGLCNYAVELSPRPLSQYTIPSSIRRLNDKRQSMDAYSCSSKIFTTKRDSCESINSFSKDQSLNLNELFYGTTLVHTGMENLDHLVNQSSNRPSSNPAPDIRIPPTRKVVNEQTGFIWGSTTVHNISNWGEGDDDEEKITKITESWDIEKQILEQLKLLDDIGHM